MVIYDEGQHPINGTGRYYSGPLYNARLPMICRNSAAKGIFNYANRLLCRKIIISPIRWAGQRPSELGIIGKIAKASKETARSFVDEFGSLFTGAVYRTGNDITQQIMSLC